MIPLHRLQDIANEELGEQGWAAVVLRSPKYGDGVRLWRKREEGGIQNVVLFLPDGMLEMSTEQRVAEYLGTMLAVVLVKEEEG